MKFTIENLFDLKQLLRHLSTGLQRLDLDNNFEGEEISAEMPAGAETRVRNPLNFVPDRYIITNKSGNSTISRSNTWTRDYIYFTNFGAEDSHVSVFLYRKQFIT